MLVPSLILARFAGQLTLSTFAPGEFVTACSPKAPTFGAPNSKHRALVTPAKRGKGNKRSDTDEGREQTSAERRASMSWAQRLKRVFNIDIETCRECGGAMKVIACIEDPVVIQKILTHLKEKAAPEPLGRVPSARAPPAGPCG